MQEASEKSKIHDLILKDRKSLSITGVIDVDSFDEETVVVYTDQGELTVRGENLHIIKISLDSGDVSLDGTITALVYTDNGKLGKQNFFSRLFK
ncbi:MAG: sporulation protein YabP [Clostridia bacterium]|nr:sporulation protein YabP [Clostridia bacterium]